MSYQLSLRRAAEKELNGLPGTVFQRINRKILSLEDEPRPFGVQKLHGQDAYRLRVGDYRILYLIDDATKRVEIISVGHRRDVYR